MKEWKVDDTTQKIICEIAIALKNLNAPIELQAIVGSWGDTLTPTQIMEYLQDYNKYGTIYKEIICSVYDNETKTAFQNN